LNEPRKLLLITLFHHQVCFSGCNCPGQKRFWSCNK